MKKISYLHFHQLTAGRHWNVNYPVRNEAAEQLKCFNHKQKNWKILSQNVLHRGRFTPRIQGVEISTPWMVLIYIKICGINLLLT